MKTQMRENHVILSVKLTCIPNYLIPWASFTFILSVSLLAFSLFPSAHTVTAAMISTQLLPNQRRQRLPHNNYDLPTRLAATVASSLKLTRILMPYSVR